MQPVLAVLKLAPILDVIQPFWNAHSLAATLRETTVFISSAFTHMTWQDSDGSFSSIGSSKGGVHRTTLSLAHTVTDLDLVGLRR